MKKYNVLLMMVALMALVGCGKKPAAHLEQEEAATKAALAWLDLIDNGKYAESWEEAATPFRNAMTKEQWVKTMEGFRQPIGNKESRELANRDYMNSIPNAPKGDYVIIQFNADFTTKKDAVETITPMLDDGKWKVSGYFMK